MSEVIWSKKMLGNFNCCKCNLRQSRASLIPKFSQPAQPWWACLKEGRGRKGGGREGSGEGKGRKEGQGGG